VVRAGSPITGAADANRREAIVGAIERRAGDRNGNPARDETNERSKGAHGTQHRYQRARAGINPANPAS
jgi:hypothetical protein